MSVPPPLYLGDPVVIIRATASNGISQRHGKTLTGMAGETFYPTIFGSGNVLFGVGFGPFVDAVTGLVPVGSEGAYPGVIGDDGNPATLVTGPTFNFGQTNLLAGGSAGLLELGGGGGFGFTQGFGARRAGTWYFRAIVLNFSAIFSNGYGIGWARAYNGGAGLGPASFSANGEYSGVDANGGGLCRAGSSVGNHQPTWWAQREQVGFEQFFTMGIGSMFEAALYLPPFVNPAGFDPNKLLPIDMPCIPCCPLDACLG